MYPQSQALKDRLLIHLSGIIGIPNRCSLSPQITPQDWIEMVRVSGDP